MPRLEKGDAQKPIDDCSHKISTTEDHCDRVDVLNII
ncbi:hypothetical protein SOVF_089970 [Spinacia oleracea]|nr:hypothetical protein SOVF_089970 [Spinacia oleracea]